MTGPSTRTNRAQSTGSASRLALLGAIIMTIANFAIAYLVSKEGAEIAGVFFVSTAIITILGNTSALGTMTGLVYFMPQALTDNPESSAANPRGLILQALRPVLTLSVIAAIGLAGCAHWLADLVTDKAVGDVTVMLRVLALTIIPWALTLLLTGATRALGTHTPTVAVTQVLRPGLQIIAFAVIFLTGEPSASTIALAWGIPVFVGAALASWWTIRLGGLAGRGPSHVSSSEFWSYTRPRSVATAMQIALERIDVVLVSAFVGTGLAGVYGALSRFITAGNFLIYSVAQAVSPNLRRALAASNWTEARALLQKTTAWLVLLAWPYFLVVGLKPEPLANLLSADYVSEANILGILAVGMLVSAASGPIELALLMLGRSTLALVGVAVAIVLDIALVWAFAARFGLAGAAAAWAISVIAQNLIGAYFVHRESSSAPESNSALLAFSGRSAIAAGGSLIAVVPIALLTPDSLVGLLTVGAVAAPILVIWSLKFSKQLGLDELLPKRFTRT